MLRSQSVEIAASPIQIRPAAREDQARIQALVRGLTADRWQGLGIGAQLVRRLLAVARAAGVQRIEGDVLAENRPMRELLLSLGFHLRRNPEGALLQFQL